MKKFYQFRDEQRKELEQHAFYDLITSDSIALKDKLLFAPVMAHFIMNFRDMNKWVIRFDKTDNEYKSIINGGTIEDETHSRLFLEDWRKLYVDDKLNWKASDVLYWLFISNEMECFRKFGIDFMKLCVDDGGDPILRYSHSESGETCGNIFFSKVSPIADQVAHHLGISLRYFGTFHLNLENGHVWKSEGVFENIELSPDAYKKMAEFSKRMFGIFEGVHDSFYNYLSTYVLNGKNPSFPDPLPVEKGITPIYPEFVIKNEQNKNGKHIEHIKSYLKKISNHEFFKWLLNTPIDPQLKLKSFIPLWIVDIMGYRDINKYVFIYDQPESESERIINDYALHLSEHSRLFYYDWGSLQLDDMLRWSASDTLEFIFLNADMDIHRENIVKFSLFGLKHRDPIIRFWFMMILELSGKEFFSHVGDVAFQAENKCNVLLPYLCGRHATEEECEAYNNMYDHFITKEISQEQSDLIIQITDMVMSSLLNNLDVSYRYAANNLLAAR
ncbi:hypothetical protein RJK59_004284 [Salmonella enterica]|nr:hypothetical protein [Salmonella enterica]EEJ9028854.1 hypothetical protein [Salmonella enterica subsp. enterica]ELC5052873.1 hypothetical protein [Salmonella enterica]